MNIDRLPTPRRPDAPSASPAAPPEQGILSFQVANETYGIDILRVREIRSFERPTRVAHAPADLLGVIDLRGTMTPIVDLRVRLGVVAPRHDGSTAVVVVDLDGTLVGIVVDAVSDVRHLRAHEMHTVPPVGPTPMARHLISLCSGSARMLLLLDIASLLDDLVATDRPH